MDYFLIFLIMAGIVAIVIFVSWIMGIKKDSDKLQQAIRNNQNLSKDINELKDKLKKETYLNADLQKELKDTKDKLEKSEKNAKKNAELNRESQIKLKKTDDKLYFAKRDIENLKAENHKLIEKIKAYEEYISNPPICFPLLANAAADYIRLQCTQLEVYFNTKPNPSYKSADLVREFKHEYAEAVKRQKLSEYKLEYLLSLYPALEDILEADFNEIQEQQPDYKAEIDPAREYLSKEEWSMLSSTERNQRALDNYINGHNKSKWQIGRDYELYIGFVYQNKGYSVDYIGNYAKFEDLGRDLICKKGDITLIIQCKYWSKEKQIHEKHINQLYGTTLAYAITHNLPIEKVKSVLITNITFSPMAIQFAKMLGVEYKENCEIRNFPRIKCNINHDEWGTTKIYHLPMDQQYDRVQIKNKGEFFAYTVEEAENAGFRRAFKHKR